MRIVIGHALMENRNGLVVDACLTRPDGHAERVAALHMIELRADRPRRITLGADKGYDAEDFVGELRSLNGPHIHVVSAVIGGTRLFLPHGATLLSARVESSATLVR